MNYELIYTLISGGTEYAVAGFTGTPEEIIIPTTYRGKPVTKIAENAFSGCISLTRITLPDSIKELGEFAFYKCSELTGIILPAGLAKLDSYLFAGCERLENITIPATITELGSSVFSGCTALKSVKLPTGLSVISEGAFAECSNLESITFGDPETDLPSDPLKIRLEASAFNGCKALQPIKGVEFCKIGAYAFYDCLGLSEITITPDLDTTDSEILGEFAFAASEPNTSSLETVIINTGIKTIGDSAFKNCTALDELSINSNLEALGEEAIRNCIKLKEINLPETLQTIGAWAFADCTSLTTINIPSNIEGLPTGVFFNCASLTELHFTANIKSFGTQALFGCTKLNTLYYADTADTWAQLKFGKDWVNNPYSLYTENEKIVVEDLCVQSKDISEYAFKNCTSLRKLVIADTVREIGFGAFQNCSELQEITAPFTGASRSTTEETRHFGYIFGAENYNENGDYTPVSLEVVTIKYGITSLCNYCFAGCAKLIEINLPDSLKTIGTGVFQGCPSLRTVNLSNNISVIEEYSFKDCTSLSEFNIPVNVKIIGNSAFRGCTNLAYIEIPNTVTNINEAAFYGCTSLLEVAFSNDSLLSEIGANAFENCSNLLKITIPGSVASIDSGVFSGCPLLTIYCECDSRRIGWAEDWKASDTPVIWNCLENDIAETTGVIYKIINNIRYQYSPENGGQWSVIKQSTKIKEADIIAEISYKTGRIEDAPTKKYPVTIITSEAFAECADLAKVIIPHSVKTIESKAFKGCSSLSTVVIGQGVTQIGEAAFENCAKLTKITLLSTNPATLATSDFGTLGKDAKLYCHSRAVDRYKADWQLYSKKFKVDDMWIYFSMLSATQKNHFVAKDYTDTLDLRERIQILAEKPSQRDDLVYATNDDIYEYVFGIYS